LKTKLQQDKRESRRQVTDAITSGILSNAFTVADWSKWLDGEKEIDLVSLFQSMSDAGKSVKNGNLSGTEAMLVAQAVSLNAIFVDLARRAHVAELVDHLDRFIRLALKAQSQCTTTIATLALMKHPPVFAKQANIAGGPQQVNNGTVNNEVARVGMETAPNKLLETHGERLDCGTTSKTIARDTSVETLDAVDGPSHEWREGTSLTQRVSRRPAKKVPRNSKGHQLISPCTAQGSS